MARSLRIDVAHGWYHVLNRGVERRQIFPRAEANLSRAMQWLNLSYGAWFNRRQQRSGPLFQGRFKAILHDPEGAALEINRYIHLNPVRVKALGGQEARSGAEDRLGSGGAGTGPSRELVKARLDALSSYRWSSYQVYIGG
jgi:hypothetical protein